MDKQTKEIIRENEDKFETFIKLPTIIATITGVLFFILGCILMTGEEPYVGAICWFIGGIFTVLYYYISKIALSPTILKVLYLREICENSKEKEEKKEETKE